MTGVDQVHAVEALLPRPHLRRKPPPRELPARPGFTGRIGDYWRLMLRGTALQVITLGIYRFWLHTDMRRFLWASTQVAGETPEYTGTAAELLIGFLIAIGILVPVYALFFLGALELELASEFSGVTAFVGLAGFGQYAAYRARRYRLTRTVFRGIRFHQTGSAIAYAVRAMLWWLPVALTLGLAWPWAMANLERYKMRNTFYGRLGGSFAGAGTELLRRCFPIWLLVAGPLASGLAAGAALIEWKAVAEVLTSEQVKDWDTFVGFLLYKTDDIASARLGIRLIEAGGAAAALAGVLLYPVYQAIVMQWWLGGLRLGGTATASHLGVGRYYSVYLRYVLYVALFSIGYIGVGTAIMMAAVTIALHVEPDFDIGPILRTGSWIGFYVIYLQGVSTIYHVMLKARLWQAAVESTLISGYAVLDQVRADEAQSTAVGEGFADALGAGGI